MFQTVSDVNLSWQTLSNDLSITQDWAYRLKMSFDPHLAKQAKEVIFSSKTRKDPHPPIRFNDYQINVEKSHKHFGLILHKKLTFAEHVRKAVLKAKCEIGIIRFYSNTP